jgi:hypothetical protein
MSGMTEHNKREHEAKLRRDAAAKAKNPNLGKNSIQLRFNGNVPKLFELHFADQLIYGSNKITEGSYHKVCKHCILHTPVRKGYRGPVTCKCVERIRDEIITNPNVGEVVEHIMKFNGLRITMDTRACLYYMSHK